MNEREFPEALKRCGGDLELLASTAVMIGEDVPIELKRLTKAIQNGDAHQAGASAHALKGMLATFEEGAAVNGLRNVESAAFGGDLAVAQTSLDGIRADILSLTERIRAVGT
ncbi:Hpt domain-containing protein [Aporhodopirellula aestuarii]|uniref:Hpt domain-containing protein n=1 Tax=Aporhodopirellula aestuarii TaxID=2950107 RepID=A0ABT0UBD7_9BACT|nr:Hpt domain-containing protein [Aporhodopirellula aestuarii]MCM2374302.1 Hpt domain-containing protein [Aporhodopirellula aestuarii]